jgi:hypothetical protein
MASSGVDTPSLPDAPTPRVEHAASSAPKQNPPKQDRRILWVIPNFRTEEAPTTIEPLTAGGKWKIAAQDSFDFSAFLVAGVMSGLAMAEGQHHEFGWGASGAARYYFTSFGDQAIGNFMTEAMFPIALHQDPRYFTKSKGGFLRRTGYALSREVITRGDNGRSQFNTSEIAGNAVAAAISNAYYEDRSFSSTAGRWAQQIELDAFFNVLKEFWPDMRRSIFGQKY